MAGVSSSPPSPSPMDEKAKRTRDLLASFYSSNSGSGVSSSPTAASNLSPRSASSLDSINSPSFDPSSYMSLLVQKSNLEGLLQKHVQMAAEIKNLDTDLQMLVYENYNKFISATDTIKRMKSNILGMETNMEQLLAKITSVQSKSDSVNTSLFEKREHIEKLHRSRNLLRKVQFIYDLPSRLNKCTKAEAYADAVRFFTGAKPIFEVYGDSSFQECKRASEEAINTVIQNLQEKLYSDSEPIEARAEAVVLLKQLNFPVDNLKTSLLEKLEDCLLKLEDESKDISVGEISKTFKAYLIIFPDSEQRLIELAQGLFSRRYNVVRDLLKKRMSSADLLELLRTIWEDVTAIDQVLPEAALPASSLESTCSIIKQHILIAFSHLQHEISDAVAGSQSKSNENKEALDLQVVLEKGKEAVMQGSLNLLVELRQFFDEKLELLSKLKELITDWVQEGSQEFFQILEKHFLILSGSSTNNGTLGESNDSDLLTQSSDKLPTGLILVLSQLSVFIEQSVIPKITEEIAASFSGGGARVYEYGPAFIPGEICRLFRAAGEKLLHLYINTKTRKISVLLKKRFTTPNWIKHKEPREVHMFVDLLLQELDGVGTEVKQILPCGVIKRHRHSDSAGTTSTNSSRSHPREDKLTSSNTHRARSQFLESHLAKLFEQKMEIFTKVEYTQAEVSKSDALRMMQRIRNTYKANKLNLEESVISMVIKLCLKSLQEFVRLQTLNRSGYQQIQLDIEFLKAPLKQLVDDDDAAIDFLLKEVNNAAHERCLDPIPLEAPILDKLISAKLAKNKDHSATL